mmetsp:Transcript_20260/g.50641  ORF Transcript_20260/g.50641 Transcript_20260/m.50641 type:complete len:206 (+) Transcript_20260:275-892(+)
MLRAARGADPRAAQGHGHARAAARAHGADSGHAVCTERARRPAGQLRRGRRAVRQARGGLRRRHRRADADATHGVPDARGHRRRRGPDPARAVARQEQAGGVHRRRHLRRRGGHAPQRRRRHGHAGPELHRARRRRRPGRVRHLPHEVPPRRGGHRGGAQRRAARRGARRRKREAVGAHLGCLHPVLHRPDLLTLRGRPSQRVVG